METDTERSVGELAGLVPRAGAFMIDTLLFAFVLAVLLVIPMGIVTASDSTGLFLVAVILFQLVVTVAFFGYRIVLEALYGYTPGKKLLNIRVVAEDGSDIGWKAATVRNLVLVADNIPVAYLLGIGLILYDDDDQRLGDMAASTYVVEA